MKRLSVLMFVAALICAAGTTAISGVALEWRPAYQVVRVGETARVSLYAVSEEGDSRAISGLDAIMLYDETKLDFINRIQGDDGFAWMLDGFLNPSADQINQALDDGNMLYTAWPSLGEPAYATKSGLCVTTLVFTARAPACRTILSIPETYGTLAQTRVMDGIVPNVDIKGELGSARFMVVGSGVISSVAAAKNLSDGTSLELAGPIVTRVFAEQGFYMEDWDRTAGIKVTWPAGVLPSEGQTPVVQGVIRTVGGERVLEAASVNIVGECPAEVAPKPYTMLARSAQQNTLAQGLLVTVCGRAWTVTGDSFMLDDGSPQRLKVRLYGVTPPSAGALVVVTGALGAEPAGPVVRVSKSSDLRRALP